jgi:O-antigen/teichoic acid export membrane protein
MSLWIAAGDAVAKLLLASDVLVLGAVLSPALVTTYVLTGYAAVLSVNLHSLAADAVIPGLAGIIGAGDHQRAAQLRRELLAVSVLFVSGAGSAILVCNRSFVHLWVGSENYAGHWTNLLLVLLAAQTAFIRCDAYIIDAALQPARRVRVSAVAAVVAVGLSVALTHYAGIVGLCVGILVGRAVQTIRYPSLVRSCLQHAPGVAGGWLARPLAVMAVLFGGSAFVGQHLLVLQWIPWAAAVLLTATLALGVSFRWGLSVELRTAVQRRGTELAARLRRSAEAGPRT